MTNNELSDDHHVVRYVKPSLVDNETVDGSAFLRRTDEPTLSVNWLEAFVADDRETQVNEVRCLIRLKLSRNGRFAQLNVGKTKQYVAKNIKEIGISHDPLCSTDKFSADPSHAQVTGLPEGDSDEAMLIGDLIAECVTQPLYVGRLG